MGIIASQILKSYFLTQDPWVPHMNGVGEKAIESNKIREIIPDKKDEIFFFLFFLLSFFFLVSFFFFPTLYHSRTLKKRMQSKEIYHFHVELPEDLSTSLDCVAEKIAAGKSTPKKPGFNSLPHYGTRMCTYTQT